MAVQHVFSNQVADGTVTSVVRPSDWNSYHNQMVTLSGNTAGQSALAGTNVVFQGGNNVTLSGNTAAGAATIVVNAANAMQSDAGSNFVAATSPVYGTNITGTVGSNGVSLSVAPDNDRLYLIGNTSGDASSVSGGTYYLSGGNNITLSNNAGTIAISAGAGGAAAIESHWANFPALWTAAVVPAAAMRQSTSIVFPAVINMDLSINQMMAMRSVAQGTTQIATAANTSFGFTQNESHNYVFYTQGTGANSGSLQYYTSTSVGLSMSVLGSIGAASNNLSCFTSYNVPNATGTSQFTVSTAPAGSASLPFASTAVSNFLSGVRLWASNAAISLPAGEYWIAHGITSAGTTGGGAGASALTAATIAMSNLAMPNINSNIASFGTSGQLFNQFYANLGGSFTTAGGGTTASMPVTAISSMASHVVPYFNLQRIV